MKIDTNKVIKIDPELVEEGTSLPVLKSLKSTLKSIGSNKNVRISFGIIFGLLALISLAFIIIASSENTPLGYLVAGYIIYKLITEKKIKK